MNFHMFVRSRDIQVQEQKHDEDTTMYLCVLK